jgi:hypothetical protein
MVISFISLPDLFHFLYDPIIFEKAELFPGLPQFQIMLEHTEVAERGLID